MPRMIARRPAPAATPAARPRMRRQTATRPVATKTATPDKALKKVLQLAAKIDAEIAELKQDLAAKDAQRDGIVAEAASLMLESDLRTFTNAEIGYIVEIEDQMSKSSIYIDPKKLQAELKRMRKPDEFWNVVKVGVVELRKVLTDGEIERIGIKTEGKKTGEQIVIRSLADTKKKKRGAK